MEAEGISKRLNISNFDTKIECKDMRLLKAAYGPIGFKFFFQNKRGKIQSPNQDLKNAIDAEFFNNLSIEFRSKFTSEQYVGALKKATETHQYMIETLGLPEWEAGFLNEVVSFSDSPFDRLAMLSQDGIPPLLRYQLGEQLLLALINASLDSRTKGSKLRTQLDNLVALTDNKLFDKRIGVTQVARVYSTHDYSNRVIDIRFSPLRYSQDVIQKETPFRVRRAVVNGRDSQIVFDIRKKDDRVATLKVLEKAIHKDHKQVDIKGDVTDMIGIKLVVVKGRVQEIIQRFESIISNAYPHSEIEKDDCTETERGQSIRHRFMRRQFYIGDNKFEVIIYSLRDFLNNIYDVGKADEYGIYDGAAHSLYELKRVSHTATHLVPKDLYRLDVRNYHMRTQEKVIRELRDKNNFVE